jgi:addiction module HigA family antidote
MSIPNYDRLPRRQPPTHPGEMLLEEFLKPAGVSQAEAAQRMGIPFQRLNSIINGRRGVTADTAILLAALTGWDADMWLRIQAGWDLWHAMRRRPNVTIKPLVAKRRTRQSTSAAD